MRGPLQPRRTSSSLFWSSSSPPSCLLLLFSILAFSWHDCTAAEPQDQQLQQPPNNPRAALIKKYGFEGYRQLVREALGEPNDNEEEAQNNDAVTTTTTTCPMMPPSYGVDVSFPVHNPDFKVHSSPMQQSPEDTNEEEQECKPDSTSTLTLPDRQAFYNSYLQNCQRYYGGSGGVLGAFRSLFFSSDTLTNDSNENKGRKMTGGSNCVTHEEERIAMNLRQPSLMQNYTELGFAKLQAPPSLYRPLRAFWDAHAGGGGSTGEEVAANVGKREVWSEGNTYTNHWEAPTRMLSVHDAGYTRTAQLSQVITQEVGAMLRQWLLSQPHLSDDTLHYIQHLSPTSLYGIRVYPRGAVLAPHVDRLPLVTSAVINVAQDVDEGEEWPLELYGHDGRAYNVTLKEGEILLYESQSVIHGRPFPLKGNYYANVFVHFEPMGHTSRHQTKLRQNSHSQSQSQSQSKQASYTPSTTATTNIMSAKQHYQMAQARAKQISEDAISSSDLPYYIQGSEEEERKRRWKQAELIKNPRTKVLREFGQMNAHQAAARGDLEMLKEWVLEDAEILHRKDQNGWQPIHEAARGGHTEVMEYLIAQGADVNARTNKGKGGSPLWWAITKKGKHHKVVEILEKHGAVSTAPTAGSSGGRRSASAS